MISKIHRFHGYGSLRYVYRSGRTARCAAFSVKATPNPRRKSYRAAVVVSRKVNKSAVARNRIRRRLYAAVRDLAKEVKQPHDIVITVFNDSILAEQSSALNKQLKQLLITTGVIPRG